MAFAAPVTVWRWQPVAGRFATSSLNERAAVIREEDVDVVLLVQPWYALASARSYAVQATYQSGNHVGAAQAPSCGASCPFRSVTSMPVCPEVRWRSASA